MSKSEQPSVPRQRELFLRALEKPTPVERAAFLDGACGDNAGLRAAVEALLADNREDSFLERPAVGVELGSTVRITPANDEQIGTIIGRYKLLEKLGEGGFGKVWAAEQKEPVRRRVALKIIKLGMDTKQVVARFEAERQALAMMDHPNIAKVLDAGATDTGRPYFVMELVRGVRVTDYCDRNGLSTRERLDLFIKVCHAIQHAHQKGIIHRDIKPSNVLVTLHDGVPVPKVIDFGIAKATQAELTEKTIYTQHHQFIGTPAYMSPEQAEMSGLDLDTRSDIYSLGVLLYELLTGKPPFDAEQLLASGLDEMRRILREVEPVRPSTALSKMAMNDATTLAKARKMTVPSLASLIRGDLDWIVMKSLEKDRDRRYQTANELAIDINRHLNQKPVEAHPPSIFYQVRKLVRRNKLAFLAAAVVGVVVLFSVTSIMLQSIHVTRVQELSARRLVQSFNNLAKSYEVSAPPDEVIKLRQKMLALHRTQLPPEHPDTLKCMRDLASAYLSANRLAEAETILRELLNAQRKMSSSNDTTLANNQALLGEVLLRQGKWAQAEQVLREYLSILEMKQLDPSAALIVQSRLGRSLVGQKKFVEAEPLLVGAYEGLRRRYAARPAVTRGQLLTETAEHLIQLYEDWGRSRQATDWRKKLLEAKNAAENPDSVDAHEP